MAMLNYQRVCEFQKDQTTTISDAYTALALLFCYPRERSDSPIAKDSHLTMAGNQESGRHAAA